MGGKGSFSGGRVLREGGGTGQDAGVTAGRGAWRLRRVGAGAVGGQEGRKSDDSFGRQNLCPEAAILRPAP